MPYRTMPVQVKKVERSFGFLQHQFFGWKISTKISTKTYYSNRIAESQSKTHRFGGINTLYISFWFTIKPSKTSRSQEQIRAHLLCRCTRQLLRLRWQGWSKGCGLLVHIQLRSHPLWLESAGGNRPVFQDVSVFKWIPKSAMCINFLEVAPSINPSVGDTFGPHLPDGFHPNHPPAWLPDWSGIVHHAHCFLLGVDTSEHVQQVVNGHGQQPGLLQKQAMHWWILGLGTPVFSSPIWNPRALQSETRVSWVVLSPRLTEMLKPRNKWHQMRLDSATRDKHLWGLLIHDPWICLPTFLDDLWTYACPTHITQFKVSSCHPSNCLSWE